MNGKRKRLFFKTEKEAKEELEKIKKRKQKEGDEAFAIPASLREEAASCAKKLKDSGYTLTQAVERFLTCAQKLKDYEHTVEDAVNHYIAYLKRMDRSCTVADLAASLLDSKKQDGKSKAYLLDLAKRVNRFAADFGNRSVADIEPREIDDWLRNLKLSPKSRNNFRANVGVLFSYGVDRGYIERNPIERTAKAKLVDKPAEIFTVEELAALLNAADPEILPALAIGAFAGLRDAEIARLEWSEVNLARGYIEVAAHKAKSARRRLVKIQPNLSAWLSPYASRTGKVVPPNARKKEEAAREAAKLERWPNNGLRHSYASYHVAHFGDAGRTAMEMGHGTPQMVFAHYREVVSPEEAALYWQVSPATPPNILPLAGEAA